MIPEMKPQFEAILKELIVNNYLRENFTSESNKTFTTPEVLDAMNTFSNQQLTAAKEAIEGLKYDCPATIVGKTTNETIEKAINELLKFKV